MPAHVRCKVVEVSPRDDWGRSRPARDILPWADPYIARLVSALEDKYADDEEVDLADPWQPSWDATSYNDGWNTSFDDGWNDDAFMPGPLEPAGACRVPPVYGTFPLLEDIDDDL